MNTCIHSHIIWGDWKKILLRSDPILQLEGSVQQCVMSEINVLRKEAFNDFILIINLRIGKQPDDEIIMIALFF